MRGKPVTPRELQPDLRYKNITVARFINHVMSRGKKSTAERIIYSAFDHVAKKSGKDPLAIFEEAMKNVSPTVEVKSRRIGGANYQIPIEVRGRRRDTLAMRWIIGAAAAKKGRTIGERLAQELLDAAAKTGEAYKKREDVRKMAEANRAFAHFA